MTSTVKHHNSGAQKRQYNPNDLRGSSEEPKNKEQFWQEFNRLAEEMRSYKTEFGVVQQETKGVTNFADELSVATNKVNDHIQKLRSRESNLAKSLDLLRAKAEEQFETPKSRTIETQTDESRLYNDAKLIHVPLTEEQVLLVQNFADIAKRAEIAKKIEAVEAAKQVEKLEATVIVEECKENQSPSMSYAKSLRKNMPFDNRPQTFVSQTLEQEKTPKAAQFTAQFPALERKIEEPANNLKNQRTKIDSAPNKDEWVKPKKVFKPSAQENGVFQKIRVLKTNKLNLIEDKPRKTGWLAQKAGANGYKMLEKIVESEFESAPKSDSSMNDDSVSSEKGKVQESIPKPKPEIVKSSKTTPPVILRMIEEKPKANHFGNKSTTSRLQSAPQPKAEVAKKTNPPVILRMIEEKPKANHSNNKLTTMQSIPQPKSEVAKSSKTIPPVKKIEERPRANNSGNKSTGPGLQSANQPKPEFAKCSKLIPLVVQKKMEEKPKGNYSGNKSTTPCQQSTPQLKTEVAESSITTPPVILKKIEEKPEANSSDNKLMTPNPPESTSQPKADVAKNSKTVPPVVLKKIEEKPDENDSSDKLTTPTLQSVPQSEAEVAESSEAVPPVVLEKIEEKPEENDSGNKLTTPTLESIPQPETVPPVVVNEIEEKPKEKPIENLAPEPSEDALSDTKSVSESSEQPTEDLTKKAQKELKEKLEKEKKERRLKNKTAKQVADAAKHAIQAQQKWTLGRTVTIYLSYLTSIEVPQVPENFSLELAKDFLEDRIHYYKRIDDVELALFCTVLQEKLCVSLLRVIHKAYVLRKFAAQCGEQEKRTLEAMKQCQKMSEARSFQEEEERATRHLNDFLPIYLSCQEAMRSESAQIPDFLQNDKRFMYFMERWKAADRKEFTWFRAKHAFLTMARVHEQQKSRSSVFPAAIFNHLAKTEHPVLLDDGCLLSMMRADPESPYEADVFYRDVMTAVDNWRKRENVRVKRQ